MKTFEQHRARLEVLYRRRLSPVEAAELLQDLESYVTAHKRQLTAAAKPARGLSRAAWRLQGPQARHGARLRMAIHNLLEVPLSDADEILQALQALRVQGVQTHPQHLQANRLDVARALAGNPQADQPFQRASATRALSIIRRFSRTEARRIVDEIDRRAHLFLDSPFAAMEILKQALNVTGVEVVCLDVALRERAGALSWSVQEFADRFLFPRLLEDVSIEHARHVLEGNGRFALAAICIGLTRGDKDILRRVAQADIDTQAPYDDVRPEDAWRELADLAQPDLADRFQEMDFAQAPLEVWRYGTDPASRQLARAVSQLPATAHIRGLQRAVGLARFSSNDILGRLRLIDGNGRDELRSAIDGLSEADARSLLHGLAAGAPDNAWSIIRHEASLEGVKLAGVAIDDGEIFYWLARRAGFPETDAGKAVYYQALRELPPEFAQDLLRLRERKIFRATNPETIQAVEDAASPPFPSLQQLALHKVSARDAWQELAREVGRADLAGRDDRAAHEDVLLRVIQHRSYRRESLARAAGLDHLLYSHALRERAEREVAPEIAAWRELTRQLGLPEYRLSHDDPNARRAVAVGSLQVGTHTIDELVQSAGLSKLRDEAVRDQRAATLQRKHAAGPQRQHDGHSL